MRCQKVVLLLIVSLFAAAFAVYAVDERRGAPYMKSVDPVAAKPGDVVVVSGDNLDSTLIKEVYLTDEKTDIKVQVLEQSATAINFKVPANTAPGRYHLACLTTGPEPMFLVQPVSLVIE